MKSVLVLVSSLCGAAGVVQAETWCHPGTLPTPVLASADPADPLPGWPGGAEAGTAVRLTAAPVRVDGVAYVEGTMTRRRGSPPRDGVVIVAADWRCASH